MSVPHIVEPPGGRGRAMGFGAALAVLCLGGCFTYRPVDAPGPVAGDEVRVELTGAGRDNLMARRALALPELTGRLLGQDDADGLLLQVSLSPERLGYGTETVVDTVRIPRSDIRELGVRTLSRDRTIVAAALGVVGVTGAYGLFQARRSSSGGGGPGDGDVFTVVPLSALLGAIGLGP